MRKVALLALALAAGAGCATYSDHTREARMSLSRGDLHGGEAQLNRMLGVESSRELPKDWDSQTALALLERATVLQAMGDYATSSRDFTAAEKDLELLDIARDDVGSIGRYIYSDDATNYRTTPTEKLLINAFNMVNYLARRDLSGAAVEARRFSVMRKYLADYAPDESHGAFGSYLAGFVFEKLGEPDVALRYYDEVLQETEAPSLHGPIRRLAQRAPYRTPRLEQAMSRGDEGEGDAEILVVVKTGRVSVKEAQRIPVGAALGLASNYVSGDTKVLEYGLFKVVSYPELIPTRDTYESGAVSIGGRQARADLLTDIDAEVRREYETIKPRIIGSALTRMITRAIAAEGARAAGRQKSSGLGFLAAALVEGTLVALDRPDTRSWSLLPARVQIARLSVPAGTHEIEVEVRGPGGLTRLRRQVEVAPGGWAVADFTTLR